MTISHLPLQDMIASVVKTASDRLVADKHTANKIKAAAAGESYEEECCEHCGKPKSECKCHESEKMAGFIDPAFVEKLASAVDYIAANVENIAPPNRGVLGSALAKMAEMGLPADHGIPVHATNREGSLEVTTPPNGEQEYKHDKPAGEDAAASQAQTAETKANMPGGATQISNNMDKAPGQGSGSVPKATYPDDGPFHAGHEKAAGKLNELASRGKDLARRGGELLAGGKKRMDTASMKTYRPGNRAADIMDKGRSVNPSINSKGTEARKSLAARGAAGAAIGGVGASFSGGKKKEKTAAELARELILNKLAGEDVMKANISSSAEGGPLVGDGELDALISDEVPSNPTDCNEYGNAQRSLIQSNDSAINYTKGQAKKPQGKQMSEVLENPAFSPEHDSKLREQLRNAGEAGVKIAGAAAATSFLKQAAAQGVLNQETINSFKERVKTATACDPAMDPAKDSAVSKLRGMIDKQRKAKASMGDDGGIY